MNKETYLITNASPGLQENLKARRNKYLLAMGIRTVCFIGCVALPVALEWKMLLALGAIILPYIAIVVANTIIPAKTNTAPSLYLHKESEPITKRKLTLHKEPTA